MTNQDIMDLVTCFDRSTARTMKVTGEGFTLELTRDEAAGACAPAPCLLCPSPCPRCGGGPRCDCAFGGNLLCRPRPRAAAFCQSRRPGEKRRNAVSH